MRASLLLGLAALAGCTATATPKVLTPHLAPTCVEAVRLYLRPDSVKAPFHEVAYLTVEGTGLTSGGAMVLSLRNRAAELGATGVIYHPYLDRHPAFLATEGNAVAILVPSDTARVAGECALARQQWADSVQSLEPRVGMP